MLAEQPLGTGRHIQGLEAGGQIWRARIQAGEEQCPRAFHPNREKPLWHHAQVLIRNGMGLVEFGRRNDVSVTAVAAGGEGAACATAGLTLNGNRAAAAVLGLVEAADNVTIGFALEVNTVIADGEGQ